MTVCVFNERVLDVRKPVGGRIFKFVTGARSSMA